MSEVVAIVPTLGRSPWLAACVAALRAQQPAPAVVVVHQGAAELPAGTVEPGVEVVRCQRRLGFAEAVNRGLGASDGAWVALVNDDARVEAGWLAALLAAGSEGDVAAVQGWQLLDAAGDAAPRLDGCGIAWNRWWQAVQIGHGEPPPAAAEPREVFGVSGTACLLRRAALDAVALAPGRWLDPGLDSYYEDVELAVRLQAAGWRALSVPAARARHAGGVTAAGLGRRRTAWIYGNRYLVLARLFGRRLPLHLPRAWLRDVADLVRGRNQRLGILAGWARALRRLPRYLHAGAPAVPVGRLRGRLGA